MAPSKRRENHVDCGNLFDNWKVLTGPKDWDLFDAGERRCRYRIENLPNDKYGYGGSYELGIFLPVAAAGQQQELPGLIEDHQVVAVYVGMAGTVRTAVRAWGSTGGHLPEEYFEEVFEHGGSMVFRCAEGTEIKDGLLGEFDYAWNSKDRKGVRRDSDISKLLTAYSSCTPSKRRLEGKPNFIIRVRNTNRRCFFLPRTDLCNEARFQTFMDSAREEKKSRGKGTSPGLTSGGDRNRLGQGQIFAWRGMAVEIPDLPWERVRTIEDVTPEEQESEGSGEEDEQGQLPSVRIVTITLAPKEVRDSPGASTSTASRSTHVQSGSGKASGVATDLGSTAQSRPETNQSVPLEQAFRRRLNLEGE